MGAFSSNDLVELNGSLVPNGSFESPTVTNFQTNPSDPSWTYSGSSAGIVANGGSFLGTQSAADGNQTAFIKNTGLLSQVWTASAGTYTLTFDVAQLTGNDTHQQLRMNLRSSAGAIRTKTFVWSGNTITEERDATGANITKRFFAEGEQKVGGRAAGNYYYTRDHLGSIREVTDSNGNLIAQFDYDAWGNEVVVSGNMNVDFGYTGFYFHRRSGLNLSMYRAYNPTLGGWISRDPLASGIPFSGPSPSQLKPRVRIGEGLVGPNLYNYVDNDPTDNVDPLGLDKVPSYLYARRADDPLTSKVPYIFYIRVVITHLTRLSSAVSMPSTYSTRMWL